MVPSQIFEEPPSTGWGVRTRTVAAAKRRVVGRGVTARFRLARFCRTGVGRIATPGAHRPKRSEDSRRGPNHSSSPGWTTPRAKASRDTQTPTNLRQQHLRTAGARQDEEEWPARDAGHRVGRRSRRRRVGLLTGSGGAINRTQNCRGRSLNPTEGLAQRGSVAAIQVDVVAGRVRDIEANRVANNERNGFSFQFARITRARTVVAVVKKFVRLCVSEHKPTYVLQSVMFGLAQARSLRRGSGDVLLRVAILNGERRSSAYPDGP